MLTIYIVVNRLDGKAYVGFTRHTVEARIQNHIHKSRVDYKYRSYFQAAIAKHGIESFEIGVLERCRTAEEACSAERRWIDQLGCLYPVGYNIGSGGEGSLGGLRAGIRSQKWHDAVHSPELRRKQSEMMKRVRASLTPEEKERWSKNAGAALKGRKLPQLCGANNPAARAEVRKKISEYRKWEWANNPKRLAMRKKHESNL